MSSPTTISETPVAHGSTGPGRLAAWVLLGWFGLYLALGDRLVLATGLGSGSGLLPVGTALSALLGLALLAVSPPTRVLFGRMCARATPLMLFFGLGIVAPLIGAIIGFPPRTLASLVVPVACVGFLLIGARLSSRDDWGRGVGWVMAVALSANALAGLLQTLYHRGMALPFVSSLIAWDLSIAKTYGVTLITGRASGLYANPNTYSLLGGVGLLYAAFGSRGRYRLPLGLASVLVLGLGQSRSVFVGVVLALVAGALAERLRTGRPIERSVLVGAAVVIAIAATALVAAVRFSPTFATLLAARVQGLVSVFGGGPGQLDRNLVARVGFWQEAWNVVKTSPLGVFGPPNTVLGTAVDNDYVRLLLQGGVVYLASFVVALGWLAAVSRRTSLPTLMVGLPFFVAVTGLTQTNSTLVPFISAFCLIVGASLVPVIEQGSPAP